MKPRKAAGVPAKRPVGRPKAGPRPVRRSDGIYVGKGIPGATKPPSLGTRDFDEAKARLDAHMAKLVAAALQPVTVVAPNPVLKVVFDECGHGVESSVIAHLRSFWSDVSLNDVGEATCWAYQDMREDGIHEPKKVARRQSSVGKEPGWLRAMINRYAKRHGFSPPTVPLPRRIRRNDLVKVSEVQRLCEAATNGWIWDADGACWLLAADGLRATRPQAWRDEVWPMRRFIPMLMNSASRTDTIERTMWKNVGDHPWIDFRVNNYVRRGCTERMTKKQRPPVRLLRSFVRELKAWRKEDRARGIDRVIHRLDGGPAGKGLYKAFAMVREAAGLSSDITFKTLRASCGVYLVEAGCTPEEAAEMLGNTERVFTGFYDRYLAEFSFAAADALDSRSWPSKKKKTKKKRTVAPGQSQQVVPKASLGSFVAKTRRKGPER